MHCEGTRVFSNLRSRLGYLFAPLAVSSLIFFLNLGGAPLWDRDEPRNAGCAVEMLEAGDWVVPIFNAELRTHKPVLLYWLMMASYAVFGVNEFAARVPSALFSVGTVLMTSMMGRRLFGSNVGTWSGVILASSIMFGVASRAATPDAILVFFVTLSIALFVHFSFPNEAETEKPIGMFPIAWRSAAAIYAAMGFAVLAKGPVGLVVPTAVIGMYLLLVRLKSPSTGNWFRQLFQLVRVFEPRHFLQTCWHMRPITALGVCAAVAMPWYAWVWYRTDGVWVEEFLWTHNVSRATGVMEGHSGPPVLFYVVAILVGFFPWSIVAIPTALQTVRAICPESTHRVRRGTVLLACWIGVFVGVFSLASTKLPSYVTPCYPAVAMLTASYVQRWRAAATFPLGWLRLGLTSFVTVGIVLLIGLPIAASRFLPGTEWLGATGLIPLVGGVATWRSIKTTNHRLATSILAGSCVAFATVLAAVVPQTIGRHQEYGELLSMTKRHAGPLISYGGLEPSWVFYGERPIQEFPATDPAELVHFLDRHPDALVITTKRHLSDVQELADCHEIVKETDYFMRDRRLLLVRKHASPLPNDARVAGTNDGPTRK